MEKDNIFAEKRFHPNEGDDALPHLYFKDYLDKIPLVTPKKMADKIKYNLNGEKSTGIQSCNG